MSGHHFFAATVEGAAVVLSEDEAHHAAKVLRVKPGETITVSDGIAHMIVGRVAAVGDTVEIEVVERRCIQRPRPELCLRIGVIKGDRMGEAIAKAVEAGVAEIRPFVAERSIVRWDEAKRARAVQRWRSIALAAAKQCRSPWRTEVTGCDASLQVDPGKDTVVFYAEAETSLRNVLPESAPYGLDVVVGPEGDLPAAEVGKARDAGAWIASLGRRILRAETAGAVGASLIAYHYGSMG